MARSTLKIKEWFLNKEQDKASTYNMFFNIESRNENGEITTDENGFVSVVAEIISESEKAIKIKIETGANLGSTKGWTTWIPKSLMA